MNASLHNFRRIISVINLPIEGKSFQINASAEECKQIASSLGLVMLKSLSSSIILIPENIGKGAIRAKGKFSANFVEKCVITLENFESSCEEDINTLFALDISDNTEKTVFFDSAEEIVDSVNNDGTLDLAALIFEYLSLSIEPHPRKPGNSKDSLKYYCGPSKVVSKDEFSNKPFAVLGDLRRKM